MYTVLGVQMNVKGLKSRCQQGWLFLEAPKGEPIPFFSQLVEAAGIPWILVS